MIRHLVNHTAASFNRVMAQMDKTVCCFITAFRGYKYDENDMETEDDASRNDNRKRNKRLEADIKDSGLAFYRCKGGYREVDLKGNSREVTEDTFCVANNKYTDEDFVNLMVDLGVKYDQDSILITFPNKTGERKVADITGRYYCTSTRTGTIGQILDEFDHLTQSDISEYFTKLYGKSFTLERISSDISGEYVTSIGSSVNTRFLASNRFAEKYPHLAVRRRIYRRGTSMPKRLERYSELVRRRNAHNRVRGRVPR